MNLNPSNKKTRLMEKGLHRKYSESTFLQQDNTKIKKAIHKYLNKYKQKLYDLTDQEVTKVYKKVYKYAKLLTTEEFIAIKDSECNGTFLHWACWYLDERFISKLKLLNESYSYDHNNMLCSQGFTPLEWAVWGIPYLIEVTDLTEEVRILIDISEKLSNKDMLAHYAAFFGRVDVLKILNKNGLLNLNNDNNNQKTVLHFAAHKDAAKKSCNTIEVFKYLNDLIHEQHLEVKMLPVFRTAVETNHSAIVVFILKELEQKDLESFNKAKELLKGNNINVIAANAKEEEDEESAKYLESLQQQNISNIACTINGSSTVATDCVTERVVNEKRRQTTSTNTGTIVELENQGGDHIQNNDCPSLECQDENNNELLDFYIEYCEQIDLN